MESLFLWLYRIGILAARYRCHSQNIQTVEQLTAMHGYLIRFLYQQQDTPVYQRDIEKKFSIPRSTVTTILNRMEGNGMLVRKSVSEDARLKQIVLTEKGISLHHSLEQEHEQFEQILTEGLSQEEQAQLQAMLKRMCQNLENFEHKGGHSIC